MFFSFFIGFVQRKTCEIISGMEVECGISLIFWDFFIFTRLFWKNLYELSLRERFIVIHFFLGSANEAGPHGPPVELRVFRDSGFRV